MIGFLSRRLAAGVFQILLVTFIAYALFFVVSAATGARPEQRVAGRTATPEQVARVAAILGTDRPIYEQYLRFLGGVAHGDFGYSFAYRQPVLEPPYPGSWCHRCPGGTLGRDLDGPRHPTRAGWGPPAREPP